MSARILDGQALAATIRKAVLERVLDFKLRHGRAPGIDVILVGADPASRIYTRNKERASNDVGMRGRLHVLPAETDERSLFALIDSLNEDESVDGILVQLPLPVHLTPDAVIARIDVRKDVEGFHPLNVGLRSLRRPAVLPCTAVACMRLLEMAGMPLRGADALVVGCSAIVGKPVSDLLLQAEATVTIAHAATRNLADHVALADVIVVAAGKPGLIRGDWVKRGAAVIDVGIHRVPMSDGRERLVGDVDFEGVSERASVITPVPGGVGPVTIACLLENTVAAAERRLGSALEAL